MLPGKRRGYVVSTSVQLGARILRERIKVPLCVLLAAEHAEAKQALAAGEVVAVLRLLEHRSALGADLRGLRSHLEVVTRI